MAYGNAKLTEIQYRYPRCHISRPRLIWGVAFACNVDDFNMASSGECRASLAHRSTYNDIIINAQSSCMPIAPWWHNTPLFRRWWLWHHWCRNACRCYNTRSVTIINARYCAAPKHFHLPIHTGWFLKEDVLLFHYCFRGKRCLSFSAVEALRIFDSFTPPHALLKA